jgi:antitoxin VapB
MFGRLKRPSMGERCQRVLRFLETRVWPSVPKHQLGRRFTRDEEDEILGYGPGGV